MQYMYVKKKYLVYMRFSDLNLSIQNKILFSFGCIVFIASSKTHRVEEICQIHEWKRKLC